MTTCTTCGADIVRPRPVRPTVSMREIADQVAEQTGIDVRTLRNARFQRKRVHPAQCEAYWRCRHEGGFSLQQIARFFGNRDHTTVLAGIQRHEALLKGAAE